MSTDIDLHQHVDRHACLRRRGGNGADHADVVGEDADRRVARKPGQACELGWSDDFVGYEHVANARFDKGSRLIHFLAADAGSTQGDLPLRDFGTLVRLSVWPQRYA